MSLTLRCPPANTMAFGGVATGNMKANEQEIVAGIMMYQGWTLIAFACGNIILVVQLCLLDAATWDIVWATFCHKVCGAVTS